MVTRGHGSTRSGNTRKRMLSALSCHSNTRSHGAWLLRLGAQGRGCTERPPTGFSCLGARAKGPGRERPPSNRGSRVQARCPCLTQEAPKT